MNTDQRRQLIRLIAELGGAMETRYGVAEVLGENVARLDRMASLATAAAPRARRTLDVGINLGYTSALLRTLYPEPAEIFGLEHPSRELLRDRRWRRKLDELGVQIVAGDARSLPLQDRSFDVVVAGELIEHLSPESLTTDFLPAVRRVLRPGGVLVLSTPNFACLLNRVLFVVWGRTSMDLPVPQKGRTYGHLREYTGEEIVGLLEFSGFRVDRLTFAARRRAWTRGRFLPVLADELEAQVGRIRAGARGYTIVSATPMPLAAGTRPCPP